MNNFMQRIFIGLIKIYQWVLSPFIGFHCRFSPTCSQYAIEAIDKYGTIKGCYLGTKRIARCNPWCIGGHDPVP
jgi:putative membrane protein insertion efficiency factor